MLDEFYDKFYIINICFSIIIRNIFWAVEAVFEEIRAFIFLDNLKCFTAILAACFNSPSVQLLHQKIMRVGSRLALTMLTRGWVRNMIIQNVS